MRQLVSYIGSHKKAFFLAIGFTVFMGLVPVMVLGGHQIGEALDSTSFCLSCHNVHYSEGVTYRASPHSEVTCAKCHVGHGTENLVRSKIKGLTDIIPTITGNYQLPINTPLKERRPSSETCEKCHSPDKFFGDVPQIAVSFKDDEANTKSVVTRVLKVGGGRQEVATGIHWHSSGKVWYLPLDEQLRKIGWVVTENAAGEITEFVDPDKINEITPARIAREKRLMDCMDCHNRVTHLVRSPDKLIDMALAEGSIDVSLPYIKRDAVKALMPQNESLQMAYAKIEGIKEAYRVSYPKVFQEKEAYIDNSLNKLKEIARLTTFGNNLNWDTYADDSKHDDPGPDMKIDWDTLAKRDESPGCFRCHGNLVKVDNKEQDALAEVLKGNNLGRIIEAVNRKLANPDKSSKSDGNFDGASYNKVTFSGLIVSTSSFNRANLDGEASQNAKLNGAISSGSSANGSNESATGLKIPGIGLGGAPRGN